MDTLPIIPGEWKYLERQTRTGQLSVIRQLLLQADTVVHAGDPDREGQWMVDEVLDYLHNTRPVERLLVHDLNINALRKAINLFDKSPRKNSEFSSLSVSALARSHADWIYGMNMTRAYTLLGRHSGYDGVLSVGRVQTPLLALVVNRDEVIEHFKPQTYFEMQAKFRREADFAFLNAAIGKAEYCFANWKSEQKPDSFHDKSFYQAIEQKIRGKMAIVSLREEQHHVSSPPLPFNLSGLQIECALRFGYSASEVIENCQALYENYHLITYPRSDCRYLPEVFVDEVDDVVDAIRQSLPANESILKEKILTADTWRRSPCWDNKKIKSHHAIIPTSRVADSKLLNEQQQNIYQLIARYYLAQFFSDRQTTDTTLNFDVEGEVFCFSESQVTVDGWQDMVDAPDEHVLKKTDALPHKLPPWQLGEKIVCEDVEIREKKTRPPLRFTDASLMAAMSSIAPYVETTEMQQDLHDLDGLGTESTRAFIIETLFKRGYLMKAGKNIFSTPIGRDLIHALPKQATQVDMTARWEKILSQMTDMTDQDARQAAQHFLQEVGEQVSFFVDHARQKKNMAVTSVDEVLGLATTRKFYCPKCQSILIQRNGKHGIFWGCSAYPECKNALPDRIDKKGNHYPLLSSRN
jgi:DNA topoisomerase-3